MLKREPQRGDSDSNSGCSACDGSNADSGRGGSEDGDQQHNQGSNTTKHLDDHNSPPPPYGTIYFTHSLTFNSFSILLLSINFRAIRMKYVPADCKNYLFASTKVCILFCGSPCLQRSQFLQNLSGTKGNEVWALQQLNQSRPSPTTTR